MMALVIAIVMVASPVIVVVVIVVAVVVVVVKTMVVVVGAAHISEVSLSIDTYTFGVTNREISGTFKKAIMLTVVLICLNGQ